MDLQAEAQAEVLKELLSELQGHDGGRVTPGKPEPKKPAPAKVVQDDLPAYDADERLMNLFKGR